MRKSLNLTGKVFNYLTALEPTSDREKESVVWECRCVCGKMVHASVVRLTSGNKKSCGCKNKNKSDLTGQVFGRLTVREASDKRKDRHIVWVCKCECGKTCYVATRFLIRGSTKSCGCLKDENSAIFMSKRLGVTILHGKKVSKEYRQQINHFVTKQKKASDLTCFVCESQEKIHMHHLYGVNNVPELALNSDNLIELCNDCHGNFHKIYGYGLNTLAQFVEFCGGVKLEGEYI